jgi:pimeloyl-ACP methyl ester carboxylesterase
MATKLTSAGDDVRTAAKALILLNDGPRRGELAELCVAMGWRLHDAGPESSCGPRQATYRVAELLGRADSPRRCVLVGYGEMGLAALAAAYRYPQRVTAVVAIDIPFDGAVRSDVAKLSCPVMVLPANDPGDVVAAVAWFLRKRAAPACAD